MNAPVLADVKQLSALPRKGEWLTLEFRRSTGEIREATQTLCAFLNGKGGMALRQPNGRLQKYRLTQAGARAGRVDGRELG